MAVSRHELAGALAGAAAEKRRDSGNPVMSHLSVEYRVTRLVFDTGEPYEKFRGRYEAAVPPADPRPGDPPVLVADPSRAAGRAACQWRR